MANDSRNVASLGIGGTSVVVHVSAALQQLRDAEKAIIAQGKRARKRGDRGAVRILRTRWRLVADAAQHLNRVLKHAAFNR